MPVYEINTDQGTYEIDADREPTQEEALSAIAKNLATTSDSNLDRDQQLAQREARGREFIRSEQRPTLQKLIEGSLGIGEALVQPVVSIAKGAIEIPGVIAEPSKILPTGAEASRRVGMDILGMARAAAGQLPDLALGPVIGGVRQLGRLAPRTPSQAEVQNFLEKQPFEEALQRERQKVSFEGAQPELSEAIAQAAELAPPVRGAQLLTKGFNVVKAAPERILRMATKPPKQLGARFEKAAKETIGEIFNEAPNADKLGSMPLEGFQQTVKQVQKRVGAEIDEGLKQSGAPLTAGDDIARELNARADKLEKAGQPAANVQILRDRATDLTGKATDMDSLREAVTIANRENSPLFTRTREAVNPLRAQAETIANEIIAKTGGAIENKALEAIKGPEGALLRKKWSNLTLVEKQASDQLNKIINSAPAEIQPALVSSLTSLQGIAGLVGVVQGHAAGILPLISSGVTAWAKRQSKLLKDSNALVVSAYEKLRANPPAATKASSPPIVQPPSLSEAIQRAATSSREASQAALQQQALEQQVLQSLENQRYVESLGQQPF